jgi:hypothetical protein
MGIFARFVGIIFVSTMLFSCGRTGSSSDDKGPSGPDFIPPVKPASLTVQSLDDGVVFSWPKNSEKDIAGYLLYYGEETASSNVIRVDVGNVSTYAVHSLKNGSLYTFYHRAYDKSGNLGPFSDPISAIPDDQSAPAVPSQFKLLENEINNYIELTWKNPSNADLAGIVIRRKENNFPSGPQDGVVVYQGLAETFRDTSVLPNKRYYYRIFAYDEIPNYSLGTVSDSERSGIIVK